MGSKYEGQNFNRAINQLYLLERLEEKEELLLQRLNKTSIFFHGQSRNIINCNSVSEQNTSEGTQKMILIPSKEF